jgi:hypothetical protein
LSLTPFSSFGVSGNSREGVPISRFTGFRPIPFRAIDRFERNNEGSRGLDTQAKAMMIVFGLAQLSRG